MSPAMSKVILPSRRMVCTLSRVGAPGKEIFTTSPSRKNMEDELSVTGAPGAALEVLAAEAPTASWLGFVGEWVVVCWLLQLQKPTQPARKAKTQALRLIF